MNIYICTYTYTCVHTYVQPYVCINIQTLMHAYVHTNMCIYIILWNTIQCLILASSFLESNITMLCRIINLCHRTHSTLSLIAQKRVAKKWDYLHMIYNFIDLQAVDWLQLRVAGWNVPAWGDTRYTSKLYRPLVLFKRVA